MGLAPQPGARHEVHPAEASLPLAGVLIWCRSGEHTEVWLATGFWFGLVGEFFVCFWLFLFFTSGSFGTAGFCCDYFWFSFVGWFLLSFFFLVGWVFCFLFFWFFLLCHSCSEDPLHPHRWSPCHLPRLGAEAGLRGVGGEA